MDKIYISEEQLSARISKLDGASCVGINNTPSEKYNLEYANLDSAWHFVDEEPRENEMLLGRDVQGYSIYRWVHQEATWFDFHNNTGLCRWAYIEDLDPGFFRDGEWE